MFNLVPHPKCTGTRPSTGKYLGTALQDAAMLGYTVPATMMIIDWFLKSLRFSCMAARNRDPANFLTEHLSVHRKDNLVSMKAYGWFG
jgi:hypothetical protein